MEVKIKNTENVNLLKCKRLIPLIILTMIELSKLNRTKGHNYSIIMGNIL